MNNFTLPAKLVMAANLYKAVRDVRYYLLGICIEKDHIVGTDGHTLFYSKLTEQLPIDDQLIISTIGKIPAKSHTMEFKFSDGNKDGHAVCRDAYDHILGVVYFELIDGKYPNWRRVCDRSNPEPVSAIGVSCKYLDRLHKTAKLVGNRECHSALNLLSPVRAMVFDIKSVYFESTVIIMPMKL